VSGDRVIYPFRRYLRLGETSRSRWAASAPNCTARSYDRTPSSSRSSGRARRGRPGRSRPRGGRWGRLPPSVEAIQTWNIDPIKRHSSESGWYGKKPPGPCPGLQRGQPEERGHAYPRSGSGSRSGYPGSTSNSRPRIPIRIKRDEAGLELAIDEIYHRVLASDGW